MNITKKQWMIIGVIAVIAVWYFFLRKKPVESGYAAYQLDPNGIESGFAASMGKAPSPLVSSKLKPTKTSKGLRWCCAEYNTYGGCNVWEQRSLNRPCGDVA